MGIKKKRYQFKKQFIKAIERKSFEKMIALTRKDYLSECLSVDPLKEGDRLFNESSDMSDPFFNRSKNNNEVVMPESYINTALWLLDLIKLSNNNLVKDGYIYPALYCFRHYLELIMKDSIHYLKLNRGEISSDELGYERNHYLLELWELLKKYLEDNSEMDMINKLIEELNDLDKGSTQYRYPFNHKDNRIVEYTTPPILIDVYILKERMMQLYHYFEGINHLSRIKK